MKVLCFNYLSLTFPKFTQVRYEKSYMIIDFQSIEVMNKWLNIYEGVLKANAMNGALLINRSSLRSDIKLVLLDEHSMNVAGDTLILDEDAPHPTEVGKIYQNYGHSDTKVGKPEVFSRGHFSPSGKNEPIWLYMLMAIVFGCNTAALLLWPMWDLDIRWSNHLIITHLVMICLSIGMAIYFTKLIVNLTQPLNHGNKSTDSTPSAS